MPRPKSSVPGLRLAFAGLCLLALPLLTLLPRAAPAAELDWSRVADLDVIEILTHDEDGDLRETKVWFVRIDGVSYLRTNGSRWLENIRRDPDVTIRIGDALYPQRAREVTSPETIEQVDAASRRKYGFQEAFIHVFRIHDPQIIELSPPAP